VCARPHILWSSSEYSLALILFAVCINHNQQYQKKCEISDECFKIPSDYQRVQNNMIGQNEEEELLQLAIQQSLLMQEQQSKGEGLEQSPIGSISTQPNTRCVIQK